MRVSIVTGHLSQRSGGPSASIPGMVTALGRTGACAVSIVGIVDKASPDEWRAWGDRVFAARQFGPRGVGWAPSMGRLLAQTNPELVDSQGLWMYGSKVTRDWHRSTGRPYVVTPRGMLDPWGVARSRLKKRAALTLYERDHLRGASCLRVTSQLELENCRTFGLTAPIAVVPNAVSIPEEVPHSRSRAKKRRALLLSRLHPKKGIEILLRSWADVVGASTAWELVIAGPDEVGHLREMQNLARQLGLTDVKWPGEVLGQSKLDLYRSSDLFVLPTWAENFGLVIAEALAAGIPVITTTRAPWSGLRENACGWWIEPSVEELRPALQEAMALSPVDLEAMGARGRTWVASTFGWDAMAAKLMATYSWILGSGKMPDCVHTEPTGVIRKL